MSHAEGRESHLIMFLLLFEAMQFARSTSVENIMGLTLV